MIRLIADSQTMKVSKTFLVFVKTVLYEPHYLATDHTDVLY